MPNWAVAALLIGTIISQALLVYLFGTQLSLNDDPLPDIVKEIKPDDYFVAGPRFGCFALFFSLLATFDNNLSGIA
jgi:hypothetical protein